MRHLVAAAALLGLVAAVYGQTLENGFVFDDQVLVVENPLVRLPLSAALDLLRADDDGHAFRPLRVFSYMLDYHLGGGLRPQAFHASNLAYHFVVTLVLYWLAVALLDSIAGGFAAAALFTVHPLGSEAVAYVSGRRDLVCALWSLLSLRCWWAFLAPHASIAGRGSASVRGWLVAGAIACVVLAAAAKETAVVVPALGLLLWGLARARAPAGGGAGNGTALAAVAASAVAALLLLYRARVGPTLARLAEGALAPQPALSLTVLARYAALAVWPRTLCADYRSGAFRLPIAAIDLRSLGSAAGLALVLVLGIALLRRGRAAGVGLLWFLVALLPVAQLAPYGEVVAEHNAYLPLAGLGLVVGDGFAWGAASWPRASWLALAGLIAAAGARASLRAADWRDSVALWSSTVAVAPDSLRGRYNLGLAYADDGRLLEARAELERARQLAPDDRDARVALASVAGRLGDYAVAEDLARQALVERRDAAALIALGWAQLGRNDARAALLSFEEAAQRGGLPDETERGLAAARGRVGRF